MISIIVTIIEIATPIMVHTKVSSDMYFKIRLVKYGKPTTSANMLPLYWPVKY